jgi:hypothetical protein
VDEDGDEQSPRMRPMGFAASYRSLSSVWYIGCMSDTADEVQCFTGKKSVQWGLHEQNPHKKGVKAQTAFTPD